MAAGAVPAIPAALTGIPFLKATHVRLGAERWAPGSACKPLSHSQFPPFRGSHRPAPAPKPPSGQVLSAARGVGEQACSETRLAFPEKPLQPAAPIVPPESRGCWNVDPSVRVLTTAMREGFPCHPNPCRRAPLSTNQKWKDDVPRGDREKTRLLPSIYTTSYPGHEIRPAARPWLSRRGCVPTIAGDGQSYYNTSYQTQFKGEWNPRAKLSEKGTSVKLGDARSSGSVSEQKHAYRALERRTHRVYDKERAASQIYHTNLRLGDGRTRFSTLTSELFPVHRLEPVTTVRPNKYASSIPRGDEDPERNKALATTTITKLSYPEAGRWNLAPKPDLLPQKHRRQICLGDGYSGSRSFSTTQQADYQPPCQSQRVTADSKSHRESHIPFNYHNESPVTTTQAMLVPHTQQKRQLSEDTLQQIKCSHLGLPWRTPDLFSTEHKDEFTPKSRSPTEIQKPNCQVSSVSLGTLKEYSPQKKVVFAL
ncbi:TEX45 protein, partial [Steatornis caripensis]|nr:TEX45 protein [Steatornis caripensis]